MCCAATPQQCLAQVVVKAVILFVWFVEHHALPITEPRLSDPSYCVPIWRHWRMPSRYW
jgi:hypothetical protein